MARVYTLSKGGQTVQCWYLMDEVGATIQHSDTPNIKVMTFIHTKKSDPENPFFVNVMWPIKAIKQ